MVKRKSSKQPKTFKIGKRTTKNKFESDTYTTLVENLGKGGSVEYEPEKFPYTTEHTYRPDFRIRTRKGKIIYIETKGNGFTFTPDVRAKLIAFRDQHPEIDLRIVFFSDSKIGQKRKDGSFRKQSDWATQNGFTFSIRNIPEEWYEE